MRLRHAVLLTPSKSSGLNELLSCKQIAPVSLRIPFFVFKRLPTLSFSVSCKSCVCHSYENSRVCTNNSHSGTHSRVTTIIAVLSFLALANCPFCNPFVLMVFHLMGGVPPPSRLRRSYVQTCGRFNLLSLSPYFLTSLLRLRIWPTESWPL